MPDSKTAQILIVDDHQIVREGVRSLFGTVRPGWTITEAGDSEEAIALIRNESPDLIIMDITLPGLSGLEAVSRLRRQGFKKPILMFTMHMSNRLITEIREVGAQGYVRKSQAVGDLVRAIDALFAGGTFFNDGHELKAAKDKPDSRSIFFIGLEPVFGW